MSPEAPFERLRNLGAGGHGGFDEASLPPDAYEAWKKDGLRFGKFVVLSDVGRGGTSVVYRAWQHDLRREVALKVVTGLDPGLRERFLREARVGASLRHASILPVFETGESDASLWLSMPLVEGKPLDACGLGAVEAAAAVAAAARGVQAAHDAGVLHRDLKPRNIMREDGGTVRVMDFGLALTRDDATRISVTGQVLGTPQYMAPEQAAGGASDARTDVYGLGATLYRLVAGRAPYDAPSLPGFLKAIASADPPPPSSLQPVPAALETVVLKALERDPARRYPTAAELADDLDRFTRGEPVTARPLSGADRAWRLLKRRRSWIAVGAFGLALSATGLVVGRYSGKAEDPKPGPGVPATPAAVQAGVEAEAQAELALDAARELRAKGRSAEAIAAYVDAQRRFPESWQCWADCGEYRRELGDFKTAEGDLTRALALRPTDRRLTVLRGEVRLGSKNLDAAEADFERAILLDPASIEGYLGRSNVRTIRGDWKGAKEDLDTAVGLEPRNLEPHRRRAAFLRQTGDLAGAIREWDETIAQFGEAAPFLWARAEIKLQARDYAGAVADYERMAVLNPDLGIRCGKELEQARRGLEEQKRK
ncbi:MAG: protein kinase [Planctomycetia bacterium]|nr:protein kinase [Planctomycetia bacterium]